MERIRELERRFGDTGIVSFFSSAGAAAAALTGLCRVDLGTRRALKLEMLPRLLSEEDESDESESMLEDRDRAPRSMVLKLGPVGCVSALRATLRTPRSPQLSSAERFTGRALNWFRRASSSSSCNACVFC